MENKVILYSTHCPRCGVLQKKLTEKNVQYAENNSVDDMTALGIMEVPVLSVDGELMSFAEAVSWVNNI